ncbi:hypothetical protein [Desulfonatronovibrio hydrogenovorans]|uniref:hypothetical protein n=1 Tax=Desulfonatronovibrio hydrogenovorans TaxID=53245 RepID=UPI000690287B|nr:hypothetical protein [Desulfonatronovibrio hydrogenovorans]
MVEHKTRDLNLSGYPEINCAEQENISRFFFDKSDYELLRLVNDVYKKSKSPEQKKLLTPYLHPHGIKEAASPRALRVAYSVTQLLGSLKTGQASDRISALNSLRDEVLSTSHGPMRINTARVLIEIMKNLVRSHGDCRKQLELARDFSEVSSGKPRLVRAQLRKYRLLEMPEEWNQVAFDEHVHDVNTTGRKSPTHLIMDAWIKGIRSITVVYYNHVPREAARELLQAAAIMDINVKIGIEFIVPFRGKQVQMIWIPRGFSGSLGFLEFLSVPRIVEFMDQGKLVSRKNQSYTLMLLDSFNKNHLEPVNQKYGIRMSRLKESDFISSVGPGQASVHHLGRYIRDCIAAHTGAGTEPDISLQPVGSDKYGADNTFEASLSIPDIYDIIEDYLRPSRNPQLPSLLEGSDLPELLTLSPFELASRIKSLHSNSNITLNLCDLKVEDVIEILYDCQGHITHLEILNLKNQVLGREHDKDRIINLQTAINAGNIIKLKKYLSKMLDQVQAKDDMGRERRGKLIEILCDIPTFQSFYKDNPLGSCIGSDSTGRSRRLYGMGLVLADSLPPGARRELRKQKSSSYSRTSVGVKAYTRHTLVPVNRSLWLGVVRPGRIPGLGRLSHRKITDWDIHDYFPVPARQSNIYTMGGIKKPSAPTQTSKPENGPDQTRRISTRYLNTKIKITAKIALGFIPAFLTFYLNQDWWLLAYFGAVIWFAITGIRNIIQSVLGCGGINRPSLVKWNSYVSWDRLADSLMYTGFSVPLLDYLIKTLVLDQSLDMTVSTNPVLVYSAISLVNGIYLSTHNFFRGLPRAAIIGNFFRSILAIPLALTFNWLAGGALALMGVVAVDLILQQWAAIISKLASDTVAGIIEGLADRAQYIRRRVLDYRSKFNHLFNTYAQLEVLFPLDDVLSLLESTKELLQTIEYEKRDMVNILIVNALDLLYFWMYQPRARDVLRQMFKKMTREERKVILLSQHVLFREKQISRLLLEGLVGKRFSRPLAFYLDHWRTYLEELEYMAEKCPPLKNDSSAGSFMDDFSSPGQASLQNRI